MFSLRKKILIIIAGLLVLLAVSLFLIFRPVSTNKQLAINFFDVGQGDSELVQAPNGQTLLIDGGPDNTVLRRLGEVLPWGQAKIDYVLLTHPHADHVTGLVAVLQKYKVGRVIMTGVSDTSPNYIQFLKILKQTQLPVALAVANQEFDLDDVKFNILSPDHNLFDQAVNDLNDSSIVVKLTYGQVKVLFTGDAGAAVEKELLKNKIDLSADVLKVGHHGSDTASGQVFLQAVNPKWAIVSVAKVNQYGLPSQRIINRLARAGATVLQTADQGTIRFLANQNNIWRQQ